MTNFAIAPRALGLGSPTPASRIGAMAGRLARLVRRSPADIITTVATPPAASALPSPATAPAVGLGGGSVAASLDVVAFGAPASDVPSVESCAEIPVSREQDRPSAAATEPIAVTDVRPDDMLTAADLTCSWPQFVKGTDLESLRWMDTPDGPCLVGRFAPPVPKKLSN